MKVVKWIALSSVAAVICGGVLVSNVSAARAASTEGRTHGRLLARAKEKLGVTDEQVTQIRAVLKADKDNITSLMSRLHEAHTGLREAIQASDATEASVRTASAKVATVEADLAVERLKLYGKISPILTADQREKLNEIQGRMDDFLSGMINRIGERLAN
jgi:Spy/CpxP family protein refolding chaperone